MNNHDEICWEPKDFSLETTSVWSFPSHGDWANHDAKWRGNWSPFIPRNVILRYSSEGDLVLDQFAGGGTTLTEAKLLKRDVIGIDINAEAIAWCRRKTKIQRSETDGRVYLRVGDARNLLFIPNDSIDLICTHPPYSNIIQYSVDIEGDLSRLAANEYLHEMEKVAHECYRVIKYGRYCAIMVGDIRERGYIIPLAFYVMQLFEKAGFSLKEIVIKEQHNCRGTMKWLNRKERYDFLLIAHEYLFIFRKIR
ncbi:MAG: methyltransferase domain-containing protein [Oscillospiraceae bacterium]|nr:methyltransferase domain-containing protein [Oscillospiraceae bacterium]